MCKQTPMYLDDFKGCGQINFYYAQVWSNIYTKFRQRIHISTSIPNSKAWELTNNTFLIFSWGCLALRIVLWHHCHTFHHTPSHVILIYPISACWEQHRWRVEVLTSAEFVLTKSIPSLSVYADRLVVVLLRPSFLLSSRLKLDWRHKIWLAYLHLTHY